LLHSLRNVSLQVTTKLGIPCEKSLAEFFRRFASQKAFKLADNQVPLHGMIFRKPWEKRQVLIHLDRHIGL